MSQKLLIDRELLERLACEVIPTTPQELLDASDDFGAAIKELRAILAAPQPSAVPDCFRNLLLHAHGMTMGVDWNNGTHASHHRYQLGEAVVQCQVWLAAATSTAQGDTTKIDRPLIHNAISLLRLRRPVPPDVESVAAGLEAMLDGLHAPAGEPSAEWLEVAAMAEVKP